MNITDLRSGWESVDHRSAYSAKLSDISALNVRTPQTHHTYLRLPADMRKDPRKSLAERTRKVEDAQRLYTAAFERIMENSVDTDLEDRSRYSEHLGAYLGGAGHLAAEGAFHLPTFGLLLEKAATYLCRADRHWLEPSAVAACLRGLARTRQVPASLRFLAVMRAHLEQTVLKAEAMAPHDIAHSFSGLQRYRATETTRGLIASLATQTRHAAASGWWLTTSELRQAFTAFRLHTTGLAEVRDAVRALTDHVAHHIGNSASEEIDVMLEGFVRRTMSDDLRRAIKTLKDMARSTERPADFTKTYDALCVCIS